MPAMTKDSDLVSVQEVRSKVEQAYAAWQKYRSFSRKSRRHRGAGCSEARANARRLAELAVEETRYGNAKDKLAKNLLAADVLPRAMRGMKTVGVLREDSERKSSRSAYRWGGGRHSAHHESNLHSHLQNFDRAQGRQRDRYQSASSRPSVLLRDRGGCCPSRSPAPALPAGLVGMHSTTLEEPTP